MQFKDIVGQHNIKRRLVQTVLQERIGHAQLFLGPEGSGSLALAVAYGQFITCENRQQAEDSCGYCPSCSKYSKLIHPDLHFSYPFFAKHKDDTSRSFLAQWREAFLSNPYLSLDEWRGYLEGENKQANINLAECHQIIHKLSLKPFESDYKVLIMWLPEYLDKAANTLLKLIEEPPSKTLIVLVAQNHDLLLPTLLSRMQLIKIPPLCEQDIKDYLIHYQAASDPQAQAIASLSEGNIQIALQLAKEEDSDYFHLFSSWMRMTAADKTDQILDFVADITKRGRENQKFFLKYSIHLSRAAILLLSGVPTLVRLPTTECDFIKKFSSFLRFEQAEALIGELEKAYKHLERNANPKILFLDVSLQLVKILKFKLFPQRVNNLSTVNNGM